MARYYVGCEALVQDTNETKMIWLRAKRNKPKGPIPRACFATMHEAQQEAAKRNHAAKMAGCGFERFHYQPYDAPSATPLRAPFDR